jgi:hypothetical protein
VKWRARSTSPGCCGPRLAQLLDASAHLLTVKQRVLTSEVAAAKSVVDRMRRADSPDRIMQLVDKLNAL